MNQSQTISESPTGTVKLYKRHLLIASKNGDWPSHIENGRFYKNLFEAIAERSSEITGLKISAIQDDSMKRGYDFILYPEQIRYHNVQKRHLTQWVETALVDQHLAPSPKSSAINKAMILVCTHGKRDIRCGQCGPPLVEKIKEEIKERNLTNYLTVHPVSHIGGHSFAGNLILYPTGDWYGYITPEDIPSLFDQAIENKLLPEKWRGRMSLPPIREIPLPAKITAQTPALLRMKEVLDRLQETHPDATCELTFQNPLQLLVATILSAQCTDVRVNLVTPALFEKYPTAASFAAANRQELEQLIHSTGFFRQKARFIQEAAHKIVTLYNGEVPRTMGELLALPGVARKTANVVLGVAFQLPIGVVVDTHVDRLSHRLGLTQNDNRNKIEQDLMAITPQNLWIDLSHLLIFHGRSYCKARRPDCAHCPLQHLCPTAGTH